MTNSTQTPFEQFLDQNDEESWAAALTTLLRSVHDVDKNATQIWFSFFPLSLFRAFDASEDPDLLAAQLLVRGVYPLKEQIDSSHKFLYGHRYWPEVKKAVETFAASFTGATEGLSDQILKVARDVAVGKGRSIPDRGHNGGRVHDCAAGGTDSVQECEGRDAA